MTSENKKQLSNSSNKTVYFFSLIKNISFIIYIFIFSCFLSPTSHASTEFIKSLEQSKDSSFQTLSKWLKLTTEKKPNFYELTNFIEKHSDWPKQSLLKQKIEENDFRNCKNQDVLNWFDKNPPKSFLARKKYISLISDNKLKSYYIKLMWAENYMSPLQEKEFLKTYKSTLTSDDHINKMNYLLFNHHIEQATKLLPHLPESIKPLYKARIELQKGKTQNLDPKYMLDIGVLHNLAHMYEKQNNEQKLIEILSKASKLGGKYQLYFWNMKSKLIRNLIQEKKYQTAYLFASSHGHSNVKDSCEAEWLSGWIALQFLNKPELSIKHFSNFYNKVKLPISQARGSYWLGRAYEKFNKLDKSNNWFKISAKNYISFYGQLSICKINNCTLKLPIDPKADHEAKKLFDSNHLVKAALILESNKKYNHLVQEFIFKAIENSNNVGEIALITKIGFQLEQHHLSVESAKRASYKDIHIIESNYPVLNYIYKDHKVDQALVMALIRQESVFNHKAISSAGAMGLMQIMPHVAKETAKKINAKYHKDKLTNDPHFNTKLGVNHLDKLLQKYDGSLILSIAAYNAGDKATKQWIESNGDPRKMNNINDIIDWMEKISFYETRNYVQRVLEGKSIYNILINKRTNISLLNDLSPHIKK